MSAPTAADRRVRWLRTAAAVTRSGLLPTGSRRAAVCGAARLLTALGVRVEVHASRTAWPRTGPAPLVVANRVSPLDDLALLTAVPGVLALDGGRARTRGGLRLPSVPATSGAVAAALLAGTAVTVRPEQPGPGGGLGRFDPSLFRAAVTTGAPVCPVAVRHRGGDGRPLPGTAAATGLRAELPRLVATGGLVVEVHLLPALAVAAADAAELATLAEYAVAGVLESGLRGGPRLSAR
ncbi:hypothetical protein [Blastococcus sp. SYSU D00820]